MSHSSHQKLRPTYYYAQYQKYFKKLFNTNYVVLKINRLLVGLVEEYQKLSRSSK